MTYTYCKLKKQEKLFDYVTFQKYSMQIFIPSRLDCHESS